MFIFSKWKRWSAAKSALIDGNFDKLLSLYSDKDFNEMTIDKIAVILFKAIELNQLRRVEQLLCDFNVKESHLFLDFELINYAISIDNEDAVKLLLKYDIPLSGSSSQGAILPLNFASKLLSVKYAEIAINAGAEVNATGELGETALVAAFFGFDEVSNAGISKLQNTVKFLINQGVDAGLYNEKGFGAIHCAARVGDMKIIELLEQCGVDLDKISENHVTPLVIAAESGHTRATRFFIAKGAKVDVTFDQGHTLLDLCRDRGRFDTAQIVKTAIEDLEL